MTQIFLAIAIACAIVLALTIVGLARLWFATTDDNDDPGGSDFDAAIARWTDMLNRRKP